MSEIFHPLPPSQSSNFSWLGKQLKQVYKHWTGGSPHKRMLRLHWTMENGFCCAFLLQSMSTSTFVHWSTWVRSLCYSCADIFSVSLLSLHQNVSICKHRTVFFLELQNEHWKIILNNVSISKIWLATYQFRCKLFDNSSTRKTSLNSTFSKGYFITLAENEHISDVLHHLQLYLSSKRM